MTIIVIIVIDVILNLMKKRRSLRMHGNISSNSRKIIRVDVDLVASGAGGAAALLVEETNGRRLGRQLLHQTARKFADGGFRNDDHLADERVVHGKGVVERRVVVALVEIDGPLLELAAVAVDPVGVDVRLVAPAAPLALGRVLRVEAARGGCLLRDAGVLEG